jgi:hypothetical protein
MEIKYKVPFHSQKWDLSDWQQLGFKNYEDAKYWEKSSCAILCLKMILDSVYPQNTSSISYLIKQGVEMGAYADKIGWNHSGIVKLAESSGLKATAYENLSLKNICDPLDNGAFAIISIKWAFENYKTLKEKILFWKKYGGHLALVVGYKKEDRKLKGFYVHHTSIKPEYNWENRFIPLSEFMGGFTGRGIIVNGKER